MTTLAASVFDVFAEFDGKGATLPEICMVLCDRDKTLVISAVHRLREIGVLRIHHELSIGHVYNLMPGARRPVDGRGRPSKEKTK